MKKISPRELMKEDAPDDEEQEEEMDEDYEEEPLEGEVGEEDIDQVIQRSHKGLFSKRFGVKILFEAIVFWIAILAFATVLDLLSLVKVEFDSSWAILFVIIIVILFVYNKYFKK